MFVLQYIYAPRLEVDLKAWATLHNNHGVRREKYRTVACWQQIQNEIGDFTTMHNLLRCDTS